MSYRVKQKSNEWWTWWANNEKICCVETKDVYSSNPTDFGCIDKKDKEQKEILIHKTKF